VRLARKETRVLGYEQTKCEPEALKRAALSLGRREERKKIKEGVKT
jgi:hypothetical protein